MNKTVSFHLALNASPEDVAEIVDAINTLFGTGSTNSISPAAIAASQSPAAALATTTGDINTTAAGQNILSNGSVELDSAGLPWDERIHASTKAKSKDGKWRARRGVDAGMVTRIEKELKATMSASPNDIMAATNAAIADAPPLALPALPGAPLPASLAAVDPVFTNFVQFIVANTQSPTNPTGRLTDEWVKATLTNFGIADGSLQNLAHRTDLIPTIEHGIRVSLGL